MLAMIIDAPTPSPTISPLPSAVVQWYAQRAAAQSGLDPALVRAVIDAESGGDPKAVSKAGAIGMMQLAAATAGDCGIHDRFDPMQNVDCGAKTLGYLVHRYGITTGIAAYNFGSGDVDSVGNHLSKMPAETQTYVKNVIEEYDLLQHTTLDVLAPAAPATPSPAAQFDLLMSYAFAQPNGAPQPLLDGFALIAALERG
ncbi:MAG: lytic transglycosylase domain-containing protein [Candidatus Eremiobacteraeota bacterium]|nr:lytic transglycosylase domain-containing protein [Candidatus Eremiobacteraeota bacterium]